MKYLYFATFIAMIIIIAATIYNLSSKIKIQRRFYFKTGEWGLTIVPTIILYSNKGYLDIECKWLKCQAGVQIHY